MMEGTRPRIDCSRGQGTDIGYYGNDFANLVSALNNATPIPVDAACITDSRRSPALTQSNIFLISHSLSAPSAIRLRVTLYQVSYRKGILCGRIFFFFRLLVNEKYVSYLKQKEKCSS